MFRVGTVSIHINKLEPQRNGGEFIQQDGRKVGLVLHLKLCMIV